MTLNDLFGVWPSHVTMATDVGESHWTVAKWRQRRSIPLSAWPRVIAALKLKGKDVSAADLLVMHTRSKSPPVSDENNVGDGT